MGVQIAGIRWAGNPAALGRSTLLNDLSAYWPMDEAAGNALDVLGILPFTPSASAPTTATGKLYVTARLFTAASSQYFTHVHASALHFGDTNWTFAAWFYLVSYPIGVNYRWILKAGNGAEGGAGIGINAAHEIFVQFYTNDGGLTLTIHYGTLVSLNTWTLVGVQWDATNSKGRIRLDAGAWLEGNEVGTHTNAHADQDCFFGRQMWAADYWDGRMGPLMLWNKNLTAIEWAELYNGGAGKAYPF